MKESYLPSGFQKLAPEERFKIIRGFPPQLITDNDFFTKPPQVILQDSDCCLLFKTSKSIWESSFNQEQVKNAMEKIQGGELGILPGLKKLRLAGNLLRSGFCLFDIHHLSPIEFHLLVGELGDLNDSLENNDPTTINVNADIILQQLQTIEIPPLIETFTPSGVESHLGYLKSTCTKSLEILKMPDKLLTLAQIHSLRKGTIRNLMQLYQLETIRNNGKFLEEYQHIKYIYDNLAEIRQNAILGGSEENSLINLPIDLIKITKFTLQAFC